MTHEEILEALSDAINEADETGKLAIGDSLFDVIVALREEWGMEE